jgi:hypothetical protein
LATLFHLLAQPGPLAEVFEGSALGVFTALLGGAALFVLLRPQEPRRLLLLCGLQTVQAAALLPVLPNHWLIEFFANLCLLATAGTLMVSAGRGASGLGQASPRDAAFTGRLVEHAAPALRGVLLLAYGWAAFAKLNRDFVDPAVSCASQFSLDLVRHLGLPLIGWVSGPAGALAGWGTAAIELSVLLLLAVRGTRVLGVALGLLFHFLLVVDPLAITYDFSSALYALFLLFLPASFVFRMRLLVELAGDSPRAVRTRQILVGAGALFLLGAAAPSVPWLAVPHLVGRKVLWLLFALMFLASFVGAWRAVGWRPGSDTGGAASRRRPPLATAPVLALVLLNGLAPYLGLKTAVTFTMYSNLRVEGGVSNHFLVRTPIELGALSRNVRDLVQPQASSDPEINQWAADGLLLSRFELRRAAASVPRASLTYFDPRLGSAVRRNSVADDPVLSVAPSWWQRKLLMYRPVDAEGPTHCRW